MRDAFHHRLNRWLDSAARVTKNHHVIRRLVAGGLCAAVYVAAFWAPFVHAHPDDHDTDHHRAGAVHAHLSPHHSQPASGFGPTIGEEEHDRAVFLQLFVAVTPTPFDAPAIVPSLFALAVPPERPAHPCVEAVSGRDPPTTGSLIPRAPPACLA